MVVIRLKGEKGYPYMLHFTYMQFSKVYSSINRSLAEVVHNAGQRALYAYYDMWV